MKKLLSLFATLALTSHLVGCTSSSSKDESSAPSPDGSVEESLDSGSSSGSGDDLAVSDSSAASGDLSPEAGLDDGLGAPAAAPEAPAAVAAAEPVSGDSPPAIDMGTPPPAPGLGLDSMPPPAPVADLPPPPPAPVQEVAVAPPPPPMDIPPPVAALPSIPEPPAPPPALEPASVASIDKSSSNLGVDLGGSAPVAAASDSSEAPTKPKVMASLKKVETVPFVKSEILLNAVYVARPGDNLKNVSQMIYGNNEKLAELKKVNPSLKKSLKPGDKVYYNSPQRPTDDQKILTYYEDQGMSPEVYVSQDSDDLKKVSKQLLGFPNAWKEMWVLNSVDSKDALPAGTQLKYWKTAGTLASAAGQPASEIGSSTPNALPAAPPAPPQNEVAAAAPPPPPPAPNPEANNPANGAAATVAQGTPPPPPPAAPAGQEVAAAPPPPPPPPPTPAPKPQKQAKGSAVKSAEGEDGDMMMVMLAGGAIIAGVGATLVMKKRKAAKQKEMESVFNDTQVGA